MRTNETRPRDGPQNPRNPRKVKNCLLLVLIAIMSYVIAGSSVTRVVNPIFQILNASEKIPGRKREKERERDK